MRLDEWKKYIESEFLDESEKPRPVEKRLEPTADQKPQPLDEADFIDDVVEEIPAFESSSTTVTNGLVTRSTPTEIPEAVNQSEVPDSVAAHIKEFDIDLPSHDSFTKRRWPAESETEPIPATDSSTMDEDGASYHGDALNQSGADRLQHRGTPDLVLTTTPPDEGLSFPMTRPDAIVSAQEFADKNLAAGNVQTVSESDLQMPFSFGNDELATLAKPIETVTRRTSRIRARQARNIPVRKADQELSPVELWERVPRHMQVLLALERQEQEEVAQRSYKRPFSENRGELIARLLDPVLTLEEAARLLNVCPTTVRRYTNRGILNYYRKEPEKSKRTETAPEKETRQRRFRLSDILAFLEAQGPLPEELNWNENSEQDSSEVTTDRKDA